MGEIECFFLFKKKCYFCSKLQNKINLIVGIFNDFVKRFFPAMTFRTIQISEIERKNIIDGLFIS